MKGTRRLSMDYLEKRIVLDGAGLADPLPAPQWESVIVALNDHVRDPAAVADGVINGHGGQLGHVYAHALKGFSAHLPEAALQALLKNPNVKRIEADLVLHAFGQTVPTGVDRIDADLKLQASSAGINVDVDVAVIDSGIDRDHPDLNVVDGHRFYTIVGGPPKNRGSFDDDNYDDDNGHGSHVAGIIGAKDDDLGVVGVAPGARLWAVKVLDANGSGYVSDIIAGIDWVTERADTIEVANMSLGGQGVSQSYREAIQRSVAAGIVYVVASGNEYRDILGGDFVFGTSDDTIPAAYPEVATISAIADTDGKPGGLGGVTNEGGYADDTFADFSNFSNSDGDGLSWYHTNNPVASPGLGIDLMMPGVDIYSTYKNGGYAIASGTSMAAPHATGLAALYIAEHTRDVTGDEHVNQEDVYRIRQALIDSGKAWRSDDGLGYPAPGVPNSDSPDKHEENLGWAGTSEPVDQPPTVTITPADGSHVSGTVTVTAVASDDGGVTQVKFQVGEIWSIVDSDGSDGWTAAWDTSGYIEGSHTLVATAMDTIGQVGSSSVTVIVDNMDDPPTVEITSPADGATVSGAIVFEAEAADDRGVSHVEFFVDNTSIDVDSDGADGWSLLWGTENYPDGSYTLVAKATDTATNAITSSSVSVTVSNDVAMMHVGDLDGSKKTIGRSGKWEAFVTVTIVDSAGAPLAGATVEGTWSGAADGTVSASTASDGTITFASGELTSSSVTFTVTKVTHSTLQYNSSANSDPEEDFPSGDLDPDITLNRDSTASKQSAASDTALDELFRLLAQEDSKRKWGQERTALSALTCIL